MRDMTPEEKGRLARMIGSALAKAYLAAMEQIRAEREAADKPELMPQHINCRCTVTPVTNPPDGPGLYRMDDLIREVETGAGWA